MIRFAQPLGASGLAASGFFAALAACVVAPFVWKPRKHDWLIDCFESKSPLPGCTTCAKLDKFDWNEFLERDRKKNPNHIDADVLNKHLEALDRNAEPTKVWYWE